MERILFVDDEDEILKGLRRMLVRRAGEWQMDFVGSGPEALARLAEQPYAVIVSDIRMPVMDGATLLTRVREEHPEVVRIALSGHADQDASLRALNVAHRFLSKPCEPRNLDAVLVGALALQSLLLTPGLRSVVSGVGWLPGVPQTYEALSRELARPEATIDSVGDVLARDVGVSAKIMQIASSAFFGLAHPVTSPHEAVRHLGIELVRTLALSVQGFRNLMLHTERSSAITWLMEHGFRVAVLAREIAALEGADTSRSNCAFSAGLLHDIGKLVLLRADEERYFHCLARWADGGCSLERLETDEFGASHAEAGGYLLGAWGLLPEVFLAVARHHATPRPPGPDWTAADETGLWVRVADLLDHIEMDTGQAEEARQEMATLERGPQGERVARWAAARRSRLAQEKAA